MSDVSIKVRGATFLGWKDVLISKSLDSLCTSFSMSYIDAWDFQNGQGDFSKWYLKAGDPCEIFVDDDLFLTGYIDEVNSSYDGETRNFSVSGRDKTCDLADCASSLDDFVVYRNLTVAQMARILIAPFGIKLKENTSSGKVLPQISIEHSQTVFDVLENMSKQRGLLLMSDALGRLVIARPGDKKAQIDLIEGGPNGNILSGAVTFNFTKRFSKYAVYAQTISQRALEPGAAPELARKAKSTATDPTITRYRPRVVVAERLCTTNETIIRAQWEAKYNAAKAVKASVKLNGWRQGPKDTGKAGSGALAGVLAGIRTTGADALWDTNMLVDIDAPDLALSGQMLIDSVQFRLSDQGEIVELGLTRPDAWVPNPIVKPETSQMVNEPGAQR